MRMNFYIRRQAYTLSCVLCTASVPVQYYYKYSVLVEGRYSAYLAPLAM